MKKKLMIFLISLLTVNLDMAYSQAWKVNVLESKYREIGNILSNISEKRSFDRDKEVFAINIKKIEEGFEFRIAITRKNKFGWILRDTKDTLRGYSEINKRPVVVLGDSFSSFFSVTSDSVEYDWLKPLPPLKEGQKNIPINYEPNVWIYIFKTGVFKFYKQGFHIFSWKDPNRAHGGSILK